MIDALKLNNWSGKMVKKMANHVSHRYNRLPLLPSGPGGVQQELVVQICQCKGTMKIGKDETQSNSNFTYTNNKVRL